MVTANKNIKAPEMAFWMEDKCRTEKISYRKAANKVGVIHATIASIIKGMRPSAATVSKIAKAFGINGENHRNELEDKLLQLCGYRSFPPAIKESETMARLMDKLSACGEGQLRLIESFIDYSVTLKNGKESWRSQTQ